MLDASEVDKIVVCPLPTYCSCGGELILKDGYHRHQVHELPEIKLSVTEYQLRKGHCAQCKKTQIAQLPEGITWGITGPRLTSFLSHLVSTYRLSRRSLQKFLKEHYRFDLSLGSVFNKQRIVNDALKEPVSSIKAAVIEQSPWLNVDETGHKRDGKKQWLWAAVSSSAAFFSVERSRGKKTLANFLKGFKNVVISDRYSAYDIFDSSRRQLCWAHLKRDFQRLSEKKVPMVARLGKKLLKEESKLFELWHRFKSGGIDRACLLEKAIPIQKQVERCLEKGSHTDPKLKAARFSKNLLERSDALWTFLSVEGVEPTNNHVERCLRPAVIWRKNYFGTRSDYGSEFVARTASIVTTCRLQSKNAFEYLCQTIHHHFTKTTAQSLI
jgi:transposase